MKFVQHQPILTEPGPWTVERVGQARSIRPAWGIARSIPGKPGAQWPFDGNGVEWLTLPGCKKFRRFRSEEAAASFLAKLQAAKP